MKTTTHQSRISPRIARYVLMGCALVALCLFAGCKSSPQPQADIPLPGFDNEGPAKPKGVYAVIRRADVPLHESTDQAWAIINEQVVPPVSRGVLRGNGIRVGLLDKDKLDAYSAAMPQPVGFSRMMMGKSAYYAPIVETPRLRSDLRFEVDLTRPPKPRHVENVKGGDGSTLRLLARIETEADGRHTIVLTPQHHIPSPLDLIPRNPLDKEMDGRVYEELSLRITLRDDQIAVVGLHWPWPIGEVIDEPIDDPESGHVSLQTSTQIPDADLSDPAAPPLHLRPVKSAGDAVEPDQPATDKKPAEPTQSKPRYERIAPPLATSLGSTLLTGTRIRQPVKSVLLITIEQPPANPDAAEIQPPQ